MDKKDFIKRALEQGILLSPEALARLDGKGFDEAIKDAKNAGKVVVAGEAPHKPQITVKMKRFRSKKTVTPQDVAAFYQAKYSAISDMLSKRLSPVSINKAADIYADVDVIGMVKEKTAKGFILEDQTGEIEVVSQEVPDLDDVVGVRGSVREGKLFLQEAVWPDVPLKNEAERIAGMSILLSNTPVEKGADLIFTLEPDGERAIHVNTNPAWATVSKAGKRARLLVYRPPRKAGVKDGAVWLKKRCLPHLRGQVMGPENPFLLKTIPNVLWVVSDEPGQEYYKGVTIVSAGKSAVRLDLGTMKAEFL